MNLTPEVIALFNPRISPWRVKDGPEYGAEKEFVRGLRKKDRPRALENLREGRIFTMRIYARRGGKRTDTDRAHFYVHGANAVGFTGRGMALRRDLLAIEGVRKWQTGDEEFSVVFPPTVFDQVAAVVRPFAKKRVAPRSAAVGGVL